MDFTITTQHTGRILQLLAMLASIAEANAADDDAVKRVQDLALSHDTVTAVEIVDGGTFNPPGSASPMRGLPPFCRVAATLRPAPDSNLKIEIWLPLKQWNGRLLGMGNGGGAGYIIYGSLASGLKRGYAAVNTDLGTSPAAEVVEAHPDRWADWGHRGTHEMTVAAKAIVQTFYGTPVRHSYFIGGSTGGQQALIEAQDYPEDYDGIVAGCPANNRTHLHTMFLWNWRALRQAPGSALTPAEVALLTRAIVAACAEKSGGAPGDDFLTDPRLVNFDPATLLARSDKPAGTGNLTAPQVAALTRIYAGPVNPRTGERIFTPPPYGSEVEMGLEADAPDRPNIYPFVFMWGLGAKFAPETFDFDRDQDQVDRRLAAIVNANSPDLSGFQRHGGKLLMFSGTADSICPFQDTVEYYERVIQAQGGLARTQGFFRYFILPGLRHGFGGLGPMDIGQRLTTDDLRVDSEHDVLLALVKWVEEGAAPERMIATGYREGNPQKGVRFQRPVFPYPNFPHYRGGDIASPASFDPVEHSRGKVLVPAIRYLN